MIKRLISVLCLCVALIGCDRNPSLISEVDALPSRSECIVGIFFAKKGGVSEADFKVELQSAIPRVVKNINTATTKDLATVLPSMSMSWENATLYLQFAEKCQRKYQYSEIGLSKTKLDLIEYEVARRIIEPSVRTILVSGPYWAPD